MGLPALTTTINPYPAGRDKTQKSQVYKGTVVIGSGGQYQTNGLPWTLSSGGAAVLTAGLPNWVEMYSATTGYIYFYDPVHQSIRIYQSGVESASAAPLAELGNGASVTTDTVYFRAEVVAGS